MKQTTFRGLVATSLGVIATGCGGGGGGSAFDGGGVVIVPPPTAGPPAPPPPPTTPPPASFVPILGQIFPDPQFTPGFVAAGRGWRFDHSATDSPIASSAHPDNDVAARYEPAGASYQMTIPLLGSGTLYQTRPTHVDLAGSRYAATIASGPAAAIDKTDVGVIRPASLGAPVSHVAAVPWYITRPGGSLITVSYGVMGLAQPTPAGGVPASGIKGYSGTLYANMSGNAADSVDGTAQFNLDFAMRTGSGSLSVRLLCFMGCDYPPTKYVISKMSWSAGNASFIGELRGPDSQVAGTFTGTFAGPTASELMIAFEVPYLDPDTRQLRTLSGVLIGSG